MIQKKKKKSLESFQKAKTKKMFFSGQIETSSQHLLIFILINWFVI